MRGGNKIRGRIISAGSAASGSTRSVMHILVSPSFVVLGAGGILRVVVVLQVHHGPISCLLSVCPLPYCLSPRDGLRGDSFLSFLTLSLSDWASCE